MDDLYSAIRECNKGDYGQRFNEWAPNILVNQYSDKTHFIFELIQNAEDAGATYVTFFLYPNRLELRHNGKSFTEADIQGICGIRSTKNAPEAGKIGRFGIGFKSVYAYTNTPRIYSGKYSFRICNLIFPYAENEGVVVDNTLLILQFDKKDTTSETAYNEIQDALKKYLSLDVLFALHNVRNISCKIYPDGKEWSVCKECVPVGDGVDKVRLTQEPISSTKELLVFRTQDKQPILIGYELKADENGQDKIIPAEQHYLYVYFQTAIETHQSFYIHVPFSTTPARDNIKHDAKENQILAKNLSVLFADSIHWLLKNGYITLRFLNDVYPISDACKEETLKGIHEMGVTLLQEGLALLPAENDGYCSIQNARLPLSKNIAENITQPILQKEYGNTVCWVKSDICSPNNKPLWDYLIQHFNLPILRWREVLPRLTAEILESQSDKWLLNLFETIFPICTGLSRSTEKVDAKQIPLVRLQDGSHICCQHAGMAQVYINNPTSCKNKISAAILQDPRGRDFYAEALGIEEYNAIRELKDVIGSYIEGLDGISIRFEDNLKHFELIKRALEENSTEVPRILSKVPIVWDGLRWQKPTDCYIPADFLEHSDPTAQAVLSRMNVPWVSNDYLGKIPADVFERIGCNAGIKDIDVPKYEYYDRLHDSDSTLFDSLQNRIRYKKHQRVDDPEGWKMYHSVEHLKDILCCDSVEASVRVVDLLNAKVKKHPLYGKMTGSHSKAFNSTTTDSVEHIPSMLALELCGAKWLYDKAGILHSPTDIKKSQLAAQYEGHGTELFAQLPFEEENEAIKAAIQSVDAQYQAFLGIMLNDRDELRRMYEIHQRLQKNEQKEVSESQPLLEILKQQSSTQPEVETIPAPDDETLGEYGAVPNLKRREKKLEEAFQDGLEGPQEVVSRLKYTCCESNHVEKAFLRTQYFGKCQICSKRIIRSDGTPYFEACNILPTTSIPPEYKQSISEGWNSLCLCPNCAAEFKYGKKNLSALIETIQTYRVKEKDTHLIVCNIEMQGEKRTLKYTGKHFLALQKAIEFYNGQKFNDVQDESNS